MADGISITISGGQVGFGAVVQGSGNVVGGSMATFAAVREQVLREAIRHDESAERQRLLEEKLAELERLAREWGDESESKVHGLFDELKEHFIWIVPLVQRLVEMWFPALGLGGK